MPQILTRDYFADVVSRFETPPALDYETNGKPLSDPGSRLVGVSLAAPISGTVAPFYIPLAHREGSNAEPLILSDLADFLVKTPVVTFGGSVEYIWSGAKFGVTPRIVGDGFVAARLLQLREKGLKELTRVVLKRPVIELPDFFGGAVPDFSVLHAQDERVQQYTEGDGRNTYEFEAYARALLREMGMHAVYDLEISALMMMAEAERHGYVMHSGAMVKAIAKERAKLNELEHRIFTLLPGSRFSLASPVQLGKALKSIGVQPGQTALGNDSWAIDVLEEIATQHPVLPYIIDWKHTFSVVNRLEREQLRADDSGKVWPRWLSISYAGDPDMRSDHPDLTSLPQSARTAFVAPPGKRWFHWAWKQPRMRALAALSGDENMKHLFSTTFDFYTTVGATLRGRGAGEGTPEDREWCKKLLIAIVDYCGAPERVAARLGWTVQQAVAEIAHVYAFFPKMGDYLVVMQENTVPLAHSAMGRQWVVSQEGWLPSKMISAVLRQTVATWMKITLGRLAGQAELAHPQLVGYGQLIPVYDKVYYVLDNRVPVPAHFGYLRSMVEHTLGGVQLQAEFGVGASWGEIQLIDDLQFAQAMADFVAGHGSVQ